MIKMEIRAATIPFAVRKGKENREEERKLLETLIQLPAKTNPFNI